MFAWCTAKVAAALEAVGLQDSADPQVCRGRDGEGHEGTPKEAQRDLPAGVLPTCGEHVLTITRKTRQEY